MSGFCICARERVFATFIFSAKKLYCGREGLTAFRLSKKLCHDIVEPQVLGRKTWNDYCKPIILI